MSCILRFMYRDVIQPGDTFPMMMRKMIMALSGIAGSLVMLNVLYFTTTPLTDETRAIYFYSFSISNANTLIGSWVYVKWTHAAPTWLIVFWINSLSVICLLSNLTAPNYPHEYIQIAIIIGYILCKVPSVNLDLGRATPSM